MERYRFRRKHFDRNNRFSFIRNESGITLLELAISLMIISLMAMAIKIPKETDRRSLLNASQILRADLRYCQEMAVKEGVSYSLIFQDSNTEYFIFSSGKKIKTVTFPIGVSKKQTGSSNDIVIVYSNLGTLGGAGMTITLEIPKKFFQKITILPSSGRPRIYTLEKY